MKFNYNLIYYYLTSFKNKYTNKESTQVLANQIS